MSVSPSYRSSQLICCANQSTCFYMRTTLALDGLMIDHRDLDICSNSFHWFDYISLSLISLLHPKPQRSLSWNLGWNYLVIQKIKTRTEVSLACPYHYLCPIITLRIEAATRRILLKKGSQKFLKIHRKTPVPESLF